MQQFEKRDKHSKQRLARPVASNVSLSQNYCTTCKPWNDGETKLLDLCGVGLQSPVNHGEYVALHVGRGSFRKEHFHSLHENQQHLQKGMKISINCGNQISKVVLKSNEIQCGYLLNPGFLAIRRLLYWGHQVSSMFPFKINHDTFTVCLHFA